ncbi:MAG: hypothetical protein PVH98_10015 [Gammaproteobacteria bacterium]|jgi:hypothetical protein
MRWKTKTLMAVLVLFCSQPGWAQGVAIKPTTPVQITIVPESAVAPGSTSTFTIRASSSLPSSQLHIDITPSQGAQLLSGDLHWEGSVIPGQVRQLSITLRFDDQHQPQVSAVASIQSANSAQLAASAAYRPSVVQPTGVRLTPDHRQSSRNGQPVVEYSLH